MITVPVPYSNIELCRDQIAIILKDNLEYQYVSAYNPDADVQNIYIEAGNPNDFTELALINIGIDNVPYSNKSYGGAVTASGIINVDVYVKSKTSAGARGDSASRIKCTRLLSICRYILEDPQYKTLGFLSGPINGVSVESIGMADPEKYDAQNISMGRLVFNIIVTENNALLIGNTIEGAVTQNRIGTTGKGFRYVLDSDGPNPPLNPNFVYIIDQQGNVLQLVPGGQTYTVTVIKRIIDTIFNNQISIIDNILP